MSRDIIYDADGNVVTIDEMIAKHIAGGGRIEKEIKDSDVYLKSENGFEKVTRKCEVITFVW